MKQLIGIALLLISGATFSQDVQETYFDTRILNGHSVETLKKRVFQYRIEHRFGDMLPNWDASNLSQNFLGFDQAADIRFAFEYGITDDVMVGIGRSKGTGAPYRSLIDGFVKYRILRQNKAEKMPISLAIMGMSTLTYMKKVEDLSMIQSFPEFDHRLAYCTQVQVARKFGERFSLSVIPSYVHRNLVDVDDVNGFFSVGGAITYKVSKSFGILAEYYHNLHSSEVRTDNFNSLSAGVEFKTNGHIFKIVLTNSRGFNETQFIPYTFANWGDGQFRLGFSISRDYKL